MKEQGEKSMIKEFFAELSSTFPFGRAVNCVWDGDGSAFIKLMQDRKIIVGAVHENYC
jgi:hypothetical protein